MTAKEYFDKEYGTDHIKEVVEMGDIVSIYGLMDEYAEKCSFVSSTASEKHTMEAIEFLNIILPEHDRTSCSDEDLQNGFWSRNGYNDKGEWQGRCGRCMALQIINKDDDVPEGVDLSDCL